MHKKKSQAAGGGSPPTLRPNFNCKKGSVTAAAAACMPRRGIAAGNVINLKRPLNGKQNVWKYQNGEEKSDSDGREKDV